MPNLELRFSSKVAEDFFNCPQRNILWVSGLGAGKSWAAIQKIFMLMMTFPGYRVAILRSSHTELQRTTKQTFFKVVPQELIKNNVQGQTPYTELVNNSLVYWMHIDEFSVSSVLSLELNAFLYDQAEDLKESVYLALDSRIGRWDQCEIPESLRSHLAINKFTGKPQAPAYGILLANPPDEGEFSWLYSTFDTPKSAVVEETDSYLYKRTHSHAFFESSSVLNEALNQENLETLQSRDDEWTERFVKGKRTQGSGAIHRIDKLSILEVDDEWIKNNILRKAALYRVLDHGASAPTCCTWWGNINGVHIAYREYYRPDAIISEHRKAINELSAGEFYQDNWADPAIFKKSMEKYGGFWSVADEYADQQVYLDVEGDAPPIFWNPADNNEYATRNRINEYLRVSPMVRHPVTGEHGAPQFYYCKKWSGNPYGCHHLIQQTAAQKKKLIGTVNGKNIYSDDRDDSIADHAYDTERYYAAMHSSGLAIPERKASPGSFKSKQKNLKDRIRTLQQAGMI